jgi:hypothetical protein
MSTLTLTASQRLDLIKKFEGLLDEIILIQKAEQEAILNREVQKLPELSGKITQYTTQLAQMRLEMDPIRSRPKNPDPQEGTLRKICTQKFQRMQELAQQNHLLLENCMKFLSRIMTEIVGSRKRSTIYNQAGTLGNACNLSGILVDIKA